MTASKLQSVWCYLMEWLIVALGMGVGAIIVIMFCIWLGVI